MRKKRLPKTQPKIDITPKTIDDLKDALAERDTYFKRSIDGFELMKRLHASHIKGTYEGSRDVECAITDYTEAEVTQFRYDVLRYASKGCDIDMIAALMGVGAEFVKTNFNEELKIGYARMSVSLLRIQFSIAASGNAQMAIHLGKHFLNQKDNVDVKVTEISKVKWVIKEDDGAVEFAT